MKSSIDWDKLYEEQGKEKSLKVFNSNVLYLFWQKKSILNTINTMYCLPDSNAGYLAVLLFSSSMSSSFKFGQIVTIIHRAKQ